MTNKQIRDTIFSVFSSKGAIVAESSLYPVDYICINIDGEEILPLWFEEDVRNREYLSFFAAFDFIESEEYEEHEQEWLSNLKKTKHIFDEMEYASGLVIMRGRVAKADLTAEWFECVERFLHERTPLINALLENEKQFESNKGV